MWGALSAIRWTQWLRIEENTQATEDKIGDLLWEQMNHTETVLLQPGVTKPMDELLSRLCSRNGIENSKFQLHIVERDEVNAFALPGGHIVLYSGLLGEAHSEDEILGVMAHEMSHILLGHVMKSLGAEVSLSVLTNLTAGGVGGETLSQMAKFLAKGAYSRSMEEDADRNAVRLLVAAGISPLPMADFLRRIAKEDGKGVVESEWLSTHPDAQKRSDCIEQWAGADTTTVDPVLSEQSWLKLKQVVKSNETAAF